MGTRPLFYRYFRRHRDGEVAVYRVVGNLRSAKRLTVTYRYRGIVLAGGQRTLTLAVTRKFSDTPARTLFYLEDETSGTTRLVGYSDEDPMGRTGLVLYDPPPVTIYWAKMSQRGFSMEIPYRPVTAALGGGTTPAGELTVERLSVAMPEDLKVRDATGTVVRYKRCLKWAIGGSDGATATVWFAPVGEVARQDYRKGGLTERQELIRVIRR